MILTEVNILMYASGAPHPRKAPSLAFLNRVAAGEVDAAIDAEVLQEVLHRYRFSQSLGRRSKSLRPNQASLSTVLPITAKV